MGYIATDWLIPRVGQSFVKIGLYGKDQSKPGKPVIPESVGAVSATVYLLVMFLCIPFMFYKYMVTTTPGGGIRGASIEENGDLTGNLFPHGKLSEYLSSILCLESTALLGIADDLFDLRWRHKFFLPAIGAIPLLIVYYVDFGATHVLVPTFVQPWVKMTNIDLGWMYYAYMVSMTIFCPNSINILAGINGLEVGQSIVLGILALINDALYLAMGPNASWESHRFSAVIILPFLVSVQHFGNGTAGQQKSLSVILIATLLVWYLLLLVSLVISQRQCCCYFSLRSSTLSIHAHNCSTLFLAPDIDFPGSMMQIGYYIHLEPI